MVPRKTSHNAFTLVEVMIVAVIALIVGLAVIGGLYYVARAQRYARERTNAQRIAASMIEQARQTAFSELKTVKNEDVVVDDNRTQSIDTDDVTGKKSLILRLPDGTELASADGQDYIIVEATVTWWAGTSRQTGDERRVTILSQFAP